MAHEYAMRDGDSILVKDGVAVEIKFLWREGASETAVMSGKLKAYQFAGFTSPTFSFEPSEGKYLELGDLEIPYQRRYRVGGESLVFSVRAKEKVLEAYNREIYYDRWDRRLNAWLVRLWWKVTGQMTKVTITLRR